MPKGKAAIIVAVVIVLSILAVISGLAGSSSQSGPELSKSTTLVETQGKHFALELKEGLDVQSSP
ncbi:MAG TPA: hypothetical protein VLA68_07425 [Nitrososphaera sp.]|nr:hypothetical protein [Nitrososphaera sp.]